MAPMETPTILETMLPDYTRIAAEVERRLSVIDELEDVGTVNPARANRLRQSVLHTQFYPIL